MVACVWLLLVVRLLPQACDFGLVSDCAVWCVGVWLVGLVLVDVVSDRYCVGYCGCCFRSCQFRVFL